MGEGNAANQAESGCAGCATTIFVLGCLVLTVIGWFVLDYVYDNCDPGDLDEGCFILDYHDGRCDPTVNPCDRLEQIAKTVYPFGVSFAFLIGYVVFRLALAGRI